MRRPRFVALAVVVGAGFVACKFSSPGSGTKDAPGDDDAPPPDAGPCQVAPTTECAGGTTLRTCTTQGAPPVETTCGWGCIPGADAHCGVLQPSGGGVVPADLDPMTFGTLADVTISGDIDGAAGTIDGALPPGVEFHTNGTIGVFRAKSFTIAAGGGGVSLVGSAAIALVADGPIEVDDAVDATPCSGGSAVEPGPGGGIGGVSDKQNGQGSGAGSGGVGGGGAASGGDGGDGGNGAKGGNAFGDDVISVLVGGGGGGAGSGGGNRGRGGGGGGAIQLASNTSIVFGTAGTINAGGCGGSKGGGTNDSGGGGGAGGTILLEAPIIMMGGILAVNGGGGGGGGGTNTTNGTAGTLDRTVANGGAAGANNGGAGGTGGAGATLGGAIGGNDTNGGGGGGGVGRMRFDTRTGTATVTGTLSPALDDNPTTTTQGSAVVQ